MHITKAGCVSNTKIWRHWKKTPLKVRNAQRIGFLQWNDAKMCWLFRLSCQHCQPVTSVVSVRVPEGQTSFEVCFCLFSHMSLTRVEEMMSTRGDGFLIGCMQKRQGRIISKKARRVCTPTRWTKQYSSFCCWWQVYNTDTDLTVVRFTVPHTVCVWKTSQMRCSERWNLRFNSNSCLCPQRRVLSQDVSRREDHKCVQAQS